MVAARYVLFHDGAVRSFKKIINVLVGSLSDSGDKAGAINLLDSQGSNRDFDEIAVTPELDPIRPSWPWVYPVDGDENADKTLGELWVRSWYAHGYVVSTPGGLDIVHGRHSGRGIGDLQQGGSYPK